MSLIEMTDKVNELASSWEQFKEINNRKDKEVACNKSADPLTLSQLERQQEHLNRLEAMIQRPGAFETKEADTEHKSALNSYLRSGDERALRSLEKRALSTIADSDGGFFITRGGIDRVVEGINQYSPMRSLAALTTISGDALEVIEDFDEAYAGWTQETEARPDTKTPQLSKKIIQVHELYAQPKATQKLIDDSSIDVEDWLTGKLTDAFTRLENASFINGDGTGKPTGLLSYGNNIIEQINSEDKGVTAAALIKLYYSLKEHFAVKAKFLMNRATIQACRMLKDETSGHYLWQPALEAGSPATLFGCEVVQCAEMPTPDSGSTPIAFGDFKSGYQIVDRQGISILRDPFTDKPFVKFYATKRVGGGVLNGQAIKLLRV